MLPIPSFFSPVALWETYLRRCFAASGLSPQAIEVDREAGTTVHFWSPSVGPNPNKPSLVLIHGFGPIAIWQWRKQVQFFAPHFNVYVPDLLFFGGSTTASSGRSETFQAVSIGKLLIDELKLERFSVVGTSYGGFVAYRMAEMWPEKVERAVIASSGINMRKTDNEGLLKRAGVEKIEELMLPTSASQLRTLTDLAVFKRLNRVPDFLLNDIVNVQSHVEKLVREVTSRGIGKKLYSENRKEKMELLKGLALGRDDNPQISPLKQDVLLLWGEHDQLFPLAMATELKQLLGERVKLEVMKKTSHVPQIEDPLRFNNIVKSFLCGPS